MGNSVIFEVEADDVNLDSFSVHKTLNPKLWKDGKIDSRVRLKLLDIAWDFVDTLAVPWVQPKDIVITGSIANYNWSKYSDIDVHVIIDFKKVWEKRTDFVKDYFKAKKNEWMDAHDDLTVYGFSVEVSVEDVSEKAKSSGVFSLEDNKWISEPDDLSDARLNTEYIREKSSELMTDIDDELRRIRKAKSDDVKERCCKNLVKIFDKLKKNPQERVGERCV